MNRLDYNKISHTHCWKQNPVPPCNIPIENHKQCCLCDEPVPSQPTEEKKLCSEKFANKPCEEDIHGNCYYCGRNMLSPHKELEGGWEKEFDKKFKCECILCAEKGYPFEVQNQVMKDYISALLTEQRNEIREGIMKLFPEWLDEIEVSDEMPTDAGKAADEAMASVKRKILASLTNPVD